VRAGLLALGPKTDLKAVYGITMDDRAIFMAGWRSRAIAALDPAAIRGKPQRAEFLRLLTTGWSGRASVESTGYRLARGYMWALHELLFDAANGAMGELDAKATMQAASTRWPVVLARLLDEQPAGWLPPAYPGWQALNWRRSTSDRRVTGAGQPLAAATGARHAARSPIDQRPRWRSGAGCRHRRRRATPTCRAWPAAISAGRSGLMRRRAG
jgi:penicillin amidase